VALAMTETRIKLGPTDLSRSVAGVPDIRLLNRYFEQDPTNQEDQTDLLTRPGVRKFLEEGDGPIRQVYSQPGSFDGDIFFVSGDTVYRVDHTDNTATSIGTLATSTQAVSMTATDVYLFVADGDALYFYTDNDYARGTLTATALSAGDVIVVGSMYYQFATDVTTGSPTGLVGAPWLVKLGVNLEDSIINLSAAIKGDGSFGTQYSIVLNANTEVTVDNITATTLVARAVAPGTAGNSLATTETSSGASWGAATLANGGGSAFTEITVPDDLGIVSVGTIIGFVICVVSQGQGHNGRFYWIWPGSVTIDALDFATAERSPDPVWEVKVVGDYFWLPGESTTEIWRPSGDGDAPFIRQQGRLFDKGIWPGTIVQVKDDVMAVGTDGTVYRIDSEPVVVSTAGISQRIREAINAARTVAAPVLTPTVSLDFKNGIYSIGGVSKTLTQVCEEFADYGTYSSSDVVGGSGLLQTLSSAGPVASASSPALTSAASAAVLAAGVSAGFTAVMTFSSSLTGNGLAQVLCELVAEDVSTGWGAQGIIPSPGSGAMVYDYDVATAGSGIVTAGQHKLAFTLAGDRLAGSIDGGSVHVSSTPQSNTATRIMIQAFAQINAASSGPVSAAVESILFYPTQLDADLVGLST
jgi:hypothetical protein